MMTRHLLMGAALLVAAGFALFGDNSPTAAVLAPAPRALAANAANAAVSARVAPIAATRATSAAVTILRLEERATLVAMSGVSGAAFASHDWTLPPVQAVAPPPPPPPPSAPPLPFTFIGKAVANGQWEVFLARGGETLIVRDKMVIDGVYRIDAIAPPGMTFTYLPLSQVQQIHIGVLD